MFRLQNESWLRAKDGAKLSWSCLYSYGATGGFASGLGQGEAVCGLALMSHLPHGVGGITGAVLVTDEAIEAWGTESLLAIRPFKPCFTQTGTIDMVTLGSILTLTPLVTLWTIAAHRTVILTPGGNCRARTLSFNLVF